MIDFNSRSALAGRINWLIDRAIDNAPEEQRTYLGCSMIGDPCERAVAIAYALQLRPSPPRQCAGGLDASSHCRADTRSFLDDKCMVHDRGLPREAGPCGRADALGDLTTSSPQGCLPPQIQDVAADSCAFSPRVRRIFARGHDAEDRIVAWMRDAGFLLINEDPATHRQFEVRFCNGRMAGHADGLILLWRGKGPSPLPLPCLWECKCLGHKYFEQARKKKIRASHPKYYSQMQLYMHGLHLEHGLISCMDADTCELYHELVPYDSGEALRMISRAERIFLCIDHGELPPRSEPHRACLACKLCRFTKLCWQ